MKEKHENTTTKNKQRQKRAMGHRRVRAKWVKG